MFCFYQFNPSNKNCTFKITRKNLTNLLHIQNCTTHTQSSHVHCTVIKHNGLTTQRPCVCKPVCYSYLNKKLGVDFEHSLAVKRRVKQIMNQGT